MRKTLKSIITDDLERCIECGRSPVQIHHIFFGTSNRKNSDADGCIIPLCMDHHEGNNGIHHNRDLNLKWKRIAQEKLEKYMPREEFIRRYGKSYL